MKSKTDFTCVVTCMDGRIQHPVMEWIKEKTGIPYPDTITEPGPVRAFFENDEKVLRSIYKRVDISLYKHGAGDIFVVAHHDCAGNPVPKTEQLQHLKKSIETLRQKYPEAKVSGLWVNENWEVEEIQ